MFIKTKVNIKTKVDIIIPCYNPALNWQHSLVDNLNELNVALENYQLNVVLVNDGSDGNLVTSKHIEFLKKNLKHFLYIKIKNNKGKGYAVRKGTQHSKASILLFTDIDFPYANANIIEMITILERGEADLVSCKRNANYYNKISKQRAWLSKLLKLLLKQLMKLPVSDTQAGLKGFSTNGKQAVLNTTINRYLFDIELFKIAAKHNLIIKEIVAELKDNIQLTGVGFSILIKEFRNFLILLFK